MAPKEHGAYGQLAVPLAAALAAGRPAPSALLFTLAALTAFLAHEPLLVVVGHRGPRAQAREGPRARKRLAALTAMALCAGVAALVFAPRAARYAACVPGALALAFAPFLVRRREKTAPGEIVASMALSSAALPVALSCGLSPEAAFAGWSCWVAAFASSTVGVRSVVSRHKTGRRKDLLATVLTLAASATATTLGAVTDRRELLGALPMVALACILVAAPPHPRHLRSVGWGLVGTSLLAAAWLVYCARA